MEVDGSENVGDFRGGNIELGERFDLPASNPRIDTQFARDRHEIFLQYLQRHNAGSGPAVLGHEVDRTPLLRRRCLVVCVYQDVGVEEATSAHEFRCG